MKKTGPLDSLERTIRLALGVALALLAWGFGWSVAGIGALVLAAVALTTSFAGYCPADDALAKLDRALGRLP